MIFLSTGRCGTTRIAQILREKLPRDTFAVVHQMRFSRIANVVGNVMYYFGQSNRIKRVLYSRITSGYERSRHFVSTDPLTAMIVPDEYKSSASVLFVHIVRDDTAFARSMLRFSRSRFKSFIAHTIIPLWQPGIWPFENLLKREMIDKYIAVSVRKNAFFHKNFANHPNYLEVDMDTLFTTDALARISNRWFGTNFTITREDLKKRANESAAVVEHI